MTNPRIAIACLIFVILMAAFFGADLHTSCKQEHGPDYKCYPAAGPVVGVKWPDLKLRVAYFG